MKTRYLIMTALSAGLAGYVLMRSSRQLKLIYNEESGQLIIDLMRRCKICDDITIENLVIHLNGEAYKGYDYSESEKSFENALFVDIPDLEPGDFIEVKMKTRCTKQFLKWGKLAIL